MNFYPYIKTRKIKLLLKHNYQMVLFMAFITVLLLTIGFIGGVEYRDCLKGGICI